VLEGRMRKLECFLDSLSFFLIFFFFVRFLKLSLIKLLHLVYIVEAWARWAGEGDGPVSWEGVRM